MKIGFEDPPAAPAGTYSRHLAELLAEYAPEHEYIVDGARYKEFDLYHGFRPGLPLPLLRKIPSVMTVHNLNFLNFVRGSETVEEMEEGHLALKGGQMGHGGQVCGLLDAAAGEHGKARLAAVHHVAVVAEDGERMGAHGTGRHVQHAGQALAGDAVHGGDHQHQTLGGGEAGGQSAGLQCAVTCAAGAGLGLHLHQADGLAEDVLSSVGGPFVGFLRHGGRRGDGIDGCNF